MGEWWHTLVGVDLVGDGVGANVEHGDRVDPLMRITFGLGQKTLPEEEEKTFSGGGGGGRRWWGFAGKERE
ncbi:hypothetical protein Tco_1116552 [Tanacetum coccineum]